MCLYFVFGIFDRSDDAVRTNGEPCANKFCAVDIFLKITPSSLVAESHHVLGCG